VEEDRTYDPVDGLGTVAHLRTRLAELYREAECTGSPVRRAYTLLVLSWDGAGSDPMDRLAVRLSVGAAARLVSGGESATAVSPTAVVLLVPPGAARVRSGWPEGVRVRIAPLPDRLVEAYHFVEGLAGNLS
jgi:hypothetical protein